MATPTKITKVGAVFQAKLDNDGNPIPLADANEEVYVSPPHVLAQPKPKKTQPSNTDINLTLPSDAKANSNTRVPYVSVYNPKTKTTDIYLQEYEGILNRTPKLLDRDKKIATRNPDGSYEPTEFAKGEFSPNTVNNLANSAATRADLERTRAYTYQNSYEQINKKPPSKTEKDSALGTDTEAADPPNTEIPVADSGDDKNAGDGSTLASLNIVVDGETASEAGNLTSDLKYPVGSPAYLESDYMRFSAIKYEPAQFSSNDFAISYNPGEVLGASVYLPIQGGISDSNGVGWNEEVINPLQIAGAEIALKTIEGGGQGLQDAIAKVTGNVTGNAPEVKAAIKGSATEAAIGANILPRTARAIFNPNTELLFNGPQLRAFTFSFKLLPRSDKEALEIKRIIRFFKVNMAARTTESQLFLKAPNVFRIEYIHKDTNNSHPGINLIKDCALQNFSVDYTPDGTYMTVGDDDIGAMFSYNLTMSFMELTPVYSKDYDDELAKDHSIGY